MQLFARKGMRVMKHVEKLISGLKILIVVKKEERKKIEKFLLH